MFNKDKLLKNSSSRQQQRESVLNPKWNKKASHVGIVLSFVIFITFLVFLYSIIEPLTKTQKDKQFLLSYLETELIENFSAKLTIVLITNSSELLDEDCLEINSSAFGTNGLNFIVKNKTKDIVNFTVLTDEGMIIEWTNDEEFFKIYYSEEKFINSTSDYSCTLPVADVNNYSVGSIRTKDQIFESRVISLIDTYESDYKTLKEDLKIPLGTEFGFGFIYSNGSVIGTEEKNISINIYVEEIPIQYMDYEANINSGFLNIKVW